MKRIQNRKEIVRRERIIVTVSSLFVLTALVCAGLFIGNKKSEEQDDGYAIDFAKLETNVPQKYNEIIENDDALDYMPREDILAEGIYMEEADSGQVEIGKIQKNINELVQEIEQTDDLIGELSEEIISEDAEIAEQIDEGPAFLEASGFYLPVEGNILMHYDTEHTVYFATLDQYKYNPATIISAPEDTPVYICADATVLGIDYDEELGFSMRFDLGNGYEVIYGQIKDMRYLEGDRVSRGTQVASIAKPSKYYSVEGSNLYFAMEKNGERTNAEYLLPVQ